MKYIVIKYMIINILLVFNQTFLTRAPLYFFYNCEVLVSFLLPCLIVWFVVFMNTIIKNNVIYDLFMLSITSLFPINIFSTPYGFLMFSGGRERVKWEQMV